MRTLFTQLAAATASIVVTAGMVAFASPAAASRIDGQPRQLVVQTADLDLDQAAGRATAERRIRTAANQVCSIDDGRSSVEAACRTRAIAQALAKLGTRSAASGETR